MMSFRPAGRSLVAADAFFTSRRVQLISLAARMRFPASTRLASSSRAAA
jgi:hypothetical protein